MHQPLGGHRGQAVLDGAEEIFGYLKSPHGSEATPHISISTSLGNGLEFT